MHGWRRTTVELMPSVVVTTLPIFAAPLLNQPLYRVFLYYAIELNILMLVVCCMTLFVAPDQRAEPIDKSSLNPILVFRTTIALSATLLFVVGLLLGTVILCFAGAVVGFFISLRVQAEPTDWTLLNRLGFTFGLAPFVLLWSGITSIVLWQAGVIITAASTGVTPPSGTEIWLQYLNEIQPRILIPTISVILLGTLLRVYREVVVSKKNRHTTPRQLVQSYAKAGVGVPLAIWLLVIVSAVPVIGIVFVVTTVGPDWIGTFAVFGWLVFAFGLYVLLRSYVDWQRLRAQQAWQRGEYEVPLIPSEYAVTLPIVGKIALNGFRKRSDSDGREEHGES